MCDERAARWVVLGVASGEKMGVETVVNVLNQLFELDPAAADQLVEARVPCNDDVVDHPTISVAGDYGSGRVGLLGVLNGILMREDPSGSGVASVRDGGVLLGFVPVAFEVVFPPPGV